MKHQALLTFLVLDLGFDSINGIGGLYLKGGGLASEGLYEDLGQHMHIGR